MFEQVFLVLCEFFAAFVLTESIAPTSDPSRLNGKDEVIVVLAVEHRHEPLFAGKALVDEQVLLIMAHRVPEVDVFYLPSVPLELMAHHPVEVLLVDGIVAAESGAVVVVNHDLALVVCIVAAEVVNQRRDFALELGVEGLDHVQPSAIRLTGDNPIDVGYNTRYIYISDI